MLLDYSVSAAVQSTDMEDRDPDIVSDTALQTRARIADSIVKLIKAVPELTSELPKSLNLQMSRAQKGRGIESHLGPGNDGRDAWCARMDKWRRKADVCLRALSLLEDYKKAQMGLEVYTQI